MQAASIFQTGDTGGIASTGDPMLDPSVFPRQLSNTGVIPSSGDTQSPSTFFSRQWSGCRKEASTKDDLNPSEDDEDPSDEDPSEDDEDPGEDEEDSRLPGRTAESLKKRLDQRRKRKRAGWKKTDWTPSEDKTLLEYLRQHGRAWKDIKSLIPGRTEYSFRSRLRKLDPELNRNLKSLRSWTASEDRALLQYVQQHGRAWKKIQTLLPSRTIISLKSRLKRLDPELSGKEISRKKISRKRWTASEDESLLQYADQHGISSIWKGAEIELRFPGRCGRSVRARLKRLNLEQSGSAVPGDQILPIGKSLFTPSTPPAVLTDHRPRKNTDPPPSATWPASRGLESSSQGGMGSPVEKTICTQSGGALCQDVAGPELLDWDLIEANHRGSLHLWRETEDQQLTQSYEAQCSEVDKEIKQIFHRIADITRDERSKMEQEFEDQRLTQEITQIVHRIADIRDKRSKMEQEFKEKGAKLAQARADDDECKRWLGIRWIYTIVTSTRWG